MTLVAVVGGGQLGQMLALAGIPLGLRFRFLDPDPACPASQVGELVVGAYDDPAALRTLVRGASVVTFEFENVPHEAAAWLEAHDGEKYAGVFPPPRALEVGQDRVIEKRFFRCAGIPTPAFAAIDAEEDVASAAESVGLPAVLKTRRLGYDGKGQVVLRGESAAPEAIVRSAWRSLGGVPCVLEAFVDFRREVSTIGVRGRDGSIAVYSLVENVHRGGILRTSRAPADGDTVAARAIAHTRRLLEELRYVGTLCIEFFETAAGELLANEFAPRVHNSGHWTIEGAATSQFENHLRAILGWPLGDTSMRDHVAMLNLVGEMPELDTLLTVPGASVHLYGKAPRPGRKLGHVTVVAETREEVEVRAAAVAAQVPVAPPAHASR